MEKARCNTELYSNLRGPLNNVKPSNFWGSHHFGAAFFVWREMHVDDYQLVGKPPKKCIL